jgi:dynein heavy chain 1
VETQITVKLRDKLGSANSNANEMFRIFSKFNALFFRPHIRGAIQEYQTQLLQTVQKDIEALRDKFIRKFHNTETFKLSKVRDIPQTSGSAIWAKQLNGKLKKYMERVENVLGPQWAEHPEGKKLKEIGDMFEKHLNIQPIYDIWKEEILNFTKDMNMNHKIFDIQQKKKNQLEIFVNFDERMISLFKELRNFIYMKIKVD